MKSDCLTLSRVQRVCYCWTNDEASADAFDGRHPVKISWNELQWEIMVKSIWEQHNIDRIWCYRGADFWCDPKPWRRSFLLGETRTWWALQYWWEFWLKPLKQWQQMIPALVDTKHDRVYMHCMEEIRCFSHGWRMKMVPNKNNINNKRILMVTMMNTTVLLSSHNQLYVWMLGVLLSVSMLVRQQRQQPWRRIIIKPLYMERLSIIPFMWYRGHEWMVRRCAIIYLTVLVSRPWWMMMVDTTSMPVPCWHQHYWRRRCNNIKARVVALVQVTERQTKIVVWLSSSSSDGKCVLTDQDFELWFHNTWKHVSSHNSRTLTTTDAINTPLTQHSILLRGASANVSQDCFDTFNESFKFFEIQNS